VIGALSPKCIRLINKPTIKRMDCSKKISFYRTFVIYIMELLTILSKLIRTMEAEEFLSVQIFKISVSTIGATSYPGSFLYAPGWRKYPGWGWSRVP
jgi:hypothetical protein